MQIKVEEKDEMIMRLVHYFVTEEDYSPIVVRGVKDEIWLQNTSGPYKIIRINANYIHNKEQYDFDIMKLNNVMRQIKRKTLSWSMNALNILLNVNSDVKIEENKNIESVYLDNIKEISEPPIINEFPEINEKLLKEDGISLMIDVTNDINKKTEKENKKFEKLFSPKKIVATNAIIVINVIAFFITLLLSNMNLTASKLVEYGGLFAPYIKNMELYRLITAGFLHVSIFHLLFNMYALYILGTQVENFVGKTKFLIIYFYSMITASLMSAIIHPSVVSVGASGAIFGLLGALLYFGYYYRLYLGSILKNQIIPLIVINLLFGMIMPGVDNAAHIGGLIGGLFIALALGVEQNNEEKFKVNGIIVSLIFVAFLCYTLFFIR